MTESIDIECPNCGRTIRSSVEKCPHCRASLELYGIEDLEKIAGVYGSAEREERSEEDKASQDRTRVLGKFFGRGRK